MIYDFPQYLEAKISEGLATLHREETTRFMVLIAYAYVNGI